MSSLIEERLLEEIAALQARLSHLETAEGGVADAILNGLIVYDWDYGNSAAAWTLVAGAGAWETGPNISLSVTVPAGATGDLWVIGRARFINRTNARNNSLGMRSLLDGITGGSDTGYIGEAIIDHWTSIAVVNSFTGLAAGVHTAQFQARRFNGGDTLLVSNRQLLAVAIQA